MAGDPTSRAAEWQGMSWRSWQSWRARLALIMVAGVAAACATGGDGADKARLGTEPMATTAPTSTSRADRMPVRCFGAEGAERQAVFLHGIRSAAGADKAASDDAQRLSALAQATGWRIAAPQSRSKCERGNRGAYCWNGDDAESVSRTWNSIVRDSQQSGCLAPGKPVALLGFSNGGYFVARVAMRQTEPRPSFVVAMGSAGDTRHLAGATPQSCPELTVLIGDKDMTRREAQKFVQLLTAAGQRASFATFSGGHDVPWETLTVVLRERSGR